MKSKRGCVISLWHALLFFFMFFALEAFLLRRLLTDLRGGDLFGRYRYPLRVEYVPQISQICTDFSCFNFLPFHLFPPFLTSHFSLLTSLSLFTFLPLKSLFTFKKAFQLNSVEHHLDQIVDRTLISCISTLGAAIGYYHAAG